MKWTGNKWKNLGFEVNKEKIKEMEMGGKNIQPTAALVINLITILNKYQRSNNLWYMITNYNIVEREIKARLILVNRCYYSFRNTLKSSLISRITKLKIYKIAIKSIVIYAGETHAIPHIHTHIKEKRNVNHHMGRS